MSASNTLVANIQIVMPELLRRHGIEIIAGPAPRRTADGLPRHSIYFRDPDGNLLELIAAD